jgi:signal peptidase I
MNPVSKTHRRIRILLWLGAGVLAVVFALRMTVGDIYSVVSASMEPVLRAGDKVFVRYGEEDLKRFDLVVFRNAAGSAVVKRLAGLRGEEVLIDQSGDLWINQARPERPDFWIPMFDDRLQKVADHFLHGNQFFDPWAERSGYWEINGRFIKAGSSIGMLRHRDGVKNGELRPDGSFREGTESVGDVRVEFEVWIPEPGGILVLNLTEESDTFQVRIGLDRLESGRVFLNHFRGNSGPPVAGTLTPLARQEWIPIVFENRDNLVVLSIYGKQILDYSYDSNTISPVGSIGERVSFGATGANLRFRSIRIDRDVTYTQRGDRSAPGHLGWGVGQRLTLSPDKYYLLGDRSEVSEDSRSFGTVHRDQIIGRITHRVWPYNRRGALKLDSE